MMSTTSSLTQDTAEAATSNIDDLYANDAVETRICETNDEPGMGFTLNSDLTEWDTSEGGYIVTVTMENVDCLAKSDLVAFYNRYKAVIQQYDLKIGAFNLENADGVDIDLNVRVEDKDRAVELGRQFNQESVFDANTFDVIHTGGRGESVAESPEDVKELVESTLNR